VTAEARDPLVNAEVFVLYAIAACAFVGALIVQLKFLWASGLALPTLMSKPWKVIAVMADYNKTLRPHGQITRFVAFGLLLFIAIAALAAGRSIQTGHSPF